MTLSPNEEIVRERHSGPTLENITIPEEAVQTEQETASEKTKSPGLGFEFVHDFEEVRRRFRECNSFEKSQCNCVGNLNGMRPTSTGLVYPSLMTGMDTDDPQSSAQL